MSEQINRKSFYLSLLTVLMTILECHSENEWFCNDLSRISNAYSFGNYVFMTPGLKAVWRFDFNKFEVSNEQQTIASIFGTDRFDTVYTAFWFDYSPCIRKAMKSCEKMEKVRNLVIVIGERTKAMDSSKTYGYIAYRLKPDNTLEEIPKGFVHNWGLTSEGSFTPKFWPSFKKTGSLIIGSAFNRVEKTLYLLVTQIDDKKRSFNRIYSRDLSDKTGDWSVWTEFDANKLNGMFTIRGEVYVVDTDSNIIRYRMKDNGLIDKNTISSAKEFFNCMSNSSLLALKDSPEFRINDFNQNNTPKIDLDNRDTKFVATEEVPSNGRKTTVATGETVIESYEGRVNTTTQLKQTSKRTTTFLRSTTKHSERVSGWLIGLALLLLFTLIAFIVLIAILFRMKYKNKEEEGKWSTITAKKAPNTSPSGSVAKKDNSLESLKTVRSDS